jgi:acetyl-CoA carboxylase beta subunit
MQLAKTSALIGRLSHARLPYIILLTHPSTAGVMASFGSLGDVMIAEPNALIAFAGPRVIEATIKQILPQGFQRSEFVQEHGFVDMVVPRYELRGLLATLMAQLTPEEFMVGNSAQLPQAIALPTVSRAGLRATFKSDLMLAEPYLFSCVKTG